LPTRQAGGDTETNPTARRSWLSSKPSRESRKRATALAQHMGKITPTTHRGAKLSSGNPRPRKKTSQSSRTSAGHGNQTAPDVSSSSNGTPPTDQYKKRRRKRWTLTIRIALLHTYRERQRAKRQKKRAGEQHLVNPPVSSEATREVKPFEQKEKQRQILKNRLLSTESRHKFSALSALLASWPNLRGTTEKKKK